MRFMINAFDPIHDPAWEAYVSRHSISLSYPDNHMFLGSIDYASAARLLMIRGSATCAAFSYCDDHIFADCAQSIHPLDYPD